MNKPPLLLSFIRSRLAARFIVSFVIFAIVPVLFLGGIALYFIDLSHRRDVSNLEMQLIGQKNEEIEKFFSDTLGMLELHVGSTKDEYQKDVTASITNKQQLKILLQNMMDSNRAFEEISVIDSKGLISDQIYRGEDIELSAQRVSGFPYATDLPKFTEAVKGRNYISDVHYTLAGPMITMSAPLYDFSGGIVGVLSAEVNLSSFARSIETARLGTSGYLILLDSNGALIANGEQKDRPMGTNLSGSERVHRLLGGGILDGLAERDRYESIINKTPVVGAGKKIGDVGWVLLAEWPLSDADAIMQEIRNQIVNMTLVSIIAVLFFAPLFASRLIKPIHQLESGAAEIEKGNFEYKVKITTKDELEELGESFNAMTVGLKRLQELRNEFVFIAAHELRTPVTAIKGYLSMIFEDTAANLTDSVKQSLQTVARANERLVRLVNDILEIARSEAGRLKIEVFAVDIRESIRAILEELMPLAADKKLTVNYDPSADLPLALADAARIKEIIMNFVSNAIKYNREAGSITITHEVTDDKIITHVADTGYGLTSEDQKHMFEKFFRSEAEEFKKIQGTGLGLFITKELVEKMGGEVWVSSKKGQGSTFSFSLPIAKKV